MRRVMHWVRRVVPVPQDSDVTDGHLLERFIRLRDAAAFEALVQWHGVRRLSPGPSQRARRRGCLSGNVPGSGPQGGVDCPARDGRQLALRRRLPNGTPGKIHRRETSNHLISLGYWERQVDLHGISLGEQVIVELISDTFCPLGHPRGDGPGVSYDTRTLGVLVWGFIPVGKETSDRLAIARKG
jgi:hypothetical protein